jgi:hypothetical protein
MVVTLGFSGGDLPTRLRAVGAEVVELKMARMRQVWRLWPTFRELTALVRSSGVRVLIGNGGHPQAIGSLVSRLARVRSAFLVHSIYQPRLLKHDPPDILALTAPCDLMLAVSKAAQASVALLRPKVPNRLLYNGTPIPKVTSEDAQAARIELGVGAGDVLFGVFGRTSDSPWSATRSSVSSPNTRRSSGAWPRPLSSLGGSSSPAFGTMLPD